MKPRIVSIVAATLWAAGTAQAADLIVKVDGMRTTQGTIKLSLSDSEAAWNNKAENIAARSVPISGSEVSLHFTDLAPGTYAVQAMHDENDNGKLDTNLIGLPTEGFGFSNNPNIMRQARFDEARFTLGDESLTVVVHLN